VLFGPLQVVLSNAFFLSQGRTIWIVDAHRDDGKRFVVRADEKLTAFLELESAIRSATRGKTACYKNLPPDRAAKPYQ